MSYENPTPGFFSICTVTCLKNDNPIIPIAGATVSGVINFVRYPMTPRKTINQLILHKYF